MITEAVVVEDHEDAEEGSALAASAKPQSTTDVSTQQELVKRDQGHLADELTELSAWMAKPPYRNCGKRAQIDKRAKAKFALVMRGPATENDDSVPEGCVA